MTKKQTSGFSKIIKHCTTLTQRADEEWRASEINRAKKAIHSATKANQVAIAPHKIASNPDYVARLQAAMNKAHNEIVGRQ
ncbi:MAG: hypothetical protein ACK5ZH_03955 [Alphaproteobacteria bacterium]|jgi:hypothetical protein